MRTIGKAVLVVLAAAGLLGPACRSANQPSLHVFAWAGLIKPDLIARFEREYGCKIILAAYESNETMSADLHAGLKPCDLFAAPSFLVGTMFVEELLQPLNHALLPNLGHVDADYLNIAADKEMDHSVPYIVVHTGIAYLRSRVKDFLPTWGMFDRPDLKGRTVLLDDMRETLGAALKSLGYSLNSTNDLELAKARDVVLRWKRNQAKFAGDPVEAAFASGGIILLQAFNIGVAQAQARNSEIAFAVPFEGTAVASEDFAIPVAAVQVDLAHAFINFLHDPAVAAESTMLLGALCPNKDSYDLLDEEVRRNPAVFIPFIILAKCEGVVDLGLAAEKWTKIWDEITAAK